MFRLVAGLSVALILGPVSAAPKLKSKTPEVPSLVGTWWTGSDGDLGVVTVEFKADNVMTYSYDGGSPRTTTWRQDGAKVYFEINQKYREFDGTLKGDRLDGDSHNVVGSQWQTSLTRIRDK